MERVFSAAGFTPNNRSVKCIYYDGKDQFLGVMLQAI
jgi:hypothetical protein